MDRKGKWKLSPAYDLTFSYDTGNKWLKAHQMLINGKTDNIKHEDLIAAGKTMGLSTQRCNRVISDVLAVEKNVRDYFERVNIREEVADMIGKVIKKHFVY
jgi:serine/threonine-protein kinase HipA